MKFDSRYAAYKLVESLAQDCGLLPAMPEEQQPDAEGDGSADDDS